MSKFKPPKRLITNLYEENITPERQDALFDLQRYAHLTDEVISDLIADITPVVLRLPEEQYEQWYDFTSDLLDEISFDITDMEYDDSDYDDDDREQIIEDCCGEIVDSLYIQLAVVLQQVTESLYEQFKRSKKQKARLQVLTDQRFHRWLKLFRFYVDPYRGKSQNLFYIIQERLEDAEELQQSMKNLAQSIRASTQPKSKQTSKTSQPT